VVDRNDDASQFAELAGRVETLAVEVARRQKAEEALLKADRQKDEFLAMLAHELRNPLAPLGHAVDLMQGMSAREGGLSGAGAKTVLGIMKRQLGQLTRLVDDLLDVARITHGRLPIEKQPVPLLVVLERAIETVAPAILDQQQKFVKDLPPLSIVVDADVARLSQVFVNLLSNASKFTPAGGEIVLKCSIEDKEAVVRILDNGAGIAPDLLPGLFQPFVQADKSLDRRLSGLGIGLAVANALVQQHEGKLAVQSAGVGKGSEFIVRLPAHAAEDAVQPGRVADEPPPVAPEVLNRRKVLIVDDNVDAAQSLAMLLGFANHEARTAHDSEAALATLEGFQPDVILLDIGLPGMDGFQLARVMRSRPDTADVVLAALTGYGKEEDRAKSAEAGFDAHFTKPVSFDALDRLLNPATRPPR
jgi:CheY-like chemotaxis protein